jgi:hypothetical protein
MSPRLKASLLGLVLLALAAFATYRGIYHLDTKTTMWGKYGRSVPCFAVAALFAFGGLKYLVTGRPDTPKPIDQTTEPPPGGSP